MKVQIPESWKDIELKQFQKYNYEVHKDINDTTKLIQTISTLCDINFNDASKMSIKDVKKITGYLAQMLEQVPETFITKFRHNGIDYGFIPKLDEISIGEYADLEFYLTETSEIWNNMHLIMSILYREIEEDGNPYKIKDYKPNKEIAEGFKSLSMDIVYSASNFFLTLGEELLETIGSSTQETEEIRVQIKKTIETTGDGLK